MSCVLEPPPPILRTTKELPDIQKPLPFPSLQSQRRLIDDEGASFSPRAISRSFKPPSLQLKSSNGSTAASIISSSSSVSLLSTLTLDSISSRSSHTLKQSEQQQSHKRTPSQLSRELLPTTNYTPQDRALPLLPPQPEQLQGQSLIHPAFRKISPFAHKDSAPLLRVSDDSPDLANNKENMKRLRNLMIKRKPLKGEDLAAELGTSSLDRYGAFVVNPLL